MLPSLSGQTWYLRFRLMSSAATEQPAPPGSASTILAVEHRRGRPAGADEADRLAVLAGVALALVGDPFSDAFMAPG